MRLFLIIRGFIKRIVLSFEQNVAIYPNVTDNVVVVVGSILNTSTLPLMINVQLSERESDYRMKMKR